MNGSSNTAKQQGTGFVNLQKMIGANKGNQLGSTIQQGVGNRVGQIQSDLNKQKQTFQTELGKNQLQESDKAGAQNALNTAINAPETLSNEQVSNFQNLLSGQYKGPAGLSNTAGVEAQARELVQYGTNVGSAAGRTNLLQRYVGGPKYTQGQQRVDNLLLGQTGGAALKDIRKQAMGLESQVTGAKSQAEMEAQKAQADRKAYGQELEKQIGRYDDPSTPDDESIGAIGDIYKDVQDRTAKFNQEQQSAFQALQGVGGSDTLTQDQLTALGLQAGQNLYDINLGQFLKQAPGQVSAQQVANEEDYAKYNALNRLAGRQGSFLTDPTMAGTAAQQKMFDTEGFMNVVGARQQDVQQAKTQMDQLKAELDYRSQFTNEMRNKFQKGWAGNQSNMALFDQALASGDIGILKGLLSSIYDNDSALTWARKLVEDQAAIKQFQDLYTNQQNIYNSYNPDRILSLYGEMTSGDPLSSGGGKGNWGGGQ